MKYDTEMKQVAAP